MLVAKILDKGQIVIPKEARKKAGVIYVKNIITKNKKD